MLAAETKVDRRLQVRLRAELKLWIKHSPLLLMLVPVMAYYVLFHYVPMYGVTIAFKDLNLRLGILKSPWVGLKHLRLAFSSYMFWTSLKNTIIISVQRLVWGFPAPIILALLLNEVRHAFFKRSIQSVLYLPHFFSWVILSGIVIAFLSPSAGPIGALFKVIGIKPTNFVAEPRWFRTILITTGIWKEAGWGTIVYLAAIAGINPEFYEAALVDGANRWQQTIYITLPSLLPVVTVLLILRLGQILNAGFDQIFNLYNPLVRDVAEILDITVYQIGLQDMNYSLSTAIGLFKSAVGLVLIVATNAIATRLSEGEMGVW